MATAIHNIFHLELPLPKDDLEGNDDLERDIDALVDGCEEAIEEYIRVIQVLKIKRNYGCAKINRLPDELLERVFRVLLEEGRGSAGCIPITHVCGRWRKIALSSPALWTSVVVDGITHPDVLQTLLSRSQTLPLDVSLSTLTYPWAVHEATAIIIPAMNMLPRTRRLSMTIHRPFYNLFESLSPTTIPLLEHFEVELESTEDELVFPFLASSRPLLRTITTERGNLGLLAFASPNVTVFRFSMSRIDPSARHLLIPALLRMPNLQALSLQRLDDMIRLPHTFIEHAVPEESVVSLPHLRHLHLSGRVVDIIWMLGYLTYPSTTNVDLDFLYEARGLTRDVLDNWGNKLSQVLDTLASNTLREQRSYGSAYGATLARSGEVQHHDFFIWPLPSERGNDEPPLSQDLMSGIPDGHVHLKIEQNALPVGDIHVVRTILVLEYLPLPAIRTLQLLPYRVDKPDTFRWVKVIRPFAELVEHMTGLQGLSVVQWDLKWFSELFTFDPLRYRYTSIGPSPFLQPIVLFSSVKVLAFDGYDLDNMVGREDVSQYRRTLKVPITMKSLKGADALKSILFVWQAKREPLDEVHLFRCSQITPEVLFSLPAVIFVH
ncbi:hypothetical protein EIP91_005451 [Steccherinum ochraceum]|uniref:Uncharacterized protein n=1 Tax=Steccherinum ochraceum TaxID=92696 RepID=A0A4R0RXG9_9APHY|nr:hypothetical protein EIP91_005451 [Steccherinum ochraceum]